MYQVEEFYDDKNEIASYWLNTFIRENPDIQILRINPMLNSGKLFYVLIYRDKR